MAVRVVAGTAKGRVLAAPAGRVARPTPNRVREAIFNSLYSLGATDGVTVLDLYAGTGALGIEALSRGAGEAVFVERDLTVAGVLRGNLAATGFEDWSTVLTSDARAAVAELRSGGRRFDVALIDPPYSFDDWPALLLAVPAELMVAESDRPIDLPSGMALHHRKRHGGTVVTFATATDGGWRPDGADH